MTRQIGKFKLYFLKVCEKRVAERMEASGVLGYPPAGAGLPTSSCVKQKEPRSSGKHHTKLREQKRDHSRGMLYKMQMREKGKKDAVTMLTEERSRGFPSA